MNLYIYGLLSVESTRFIQEDLDDYNAINRSPNQRRDNTMTK